jgi:hypothetical protein
MKVSNEPHNSTRGAISCPQCTCKIYGEPISSGAYGLLQEGKMKLEREIAATRKKKALL